MAYYTGYVVIPHQTYFQWRFNTEGNGYNFDSQHGCQCYDLAAEFWWNVGFPAGYPIITSSSAYTMWDNRLSNVSYNGVTYFDLVENVSDIKQGDVIVFNYNQVNPYGHVGFADVDYASWTPDPTQPYEFPILSQNNQGTPDPQGGAYTNIHGYDIRLFLGAFRYREWNQSPTPVITNASKFPWVLYARKLRQRRGI
ncbi:MAG: CHAP domain-containing protein [Erysipelotrichaceae bacterium]|nr:CHAP domain-containing protein [Erysipelotrichaceae bacterium]